MNGCIYHTEDDLCMKFSVGDTHSWCVGKDEPCDYRKPSNADRIRSMTDEEMAKQIADWNSGDCPIVGDCMPVAQNSFTCEPWKCWLDWLKQEATDE